MSTIIQNDLATEFKSCVDLYQEGKFSESYNRIVELQKEYPDNIDIKYVTALCLMALEQHDEAEVLLPKG